MNLGVKRFLMLRFFQIAALGLQAFNTLVVVALYVQSSGWQWWYLLFPIAGVPVAVMMIVADKKKAIPEEMQFIYENQPVSKDLAEVKLSLAKISTSIARIDSDVDFIKQQSKYLGAKIDNLPLLATDDALEAMVRAGMNILGENPSTIYDRYKKTAGL